MEIRLKEGEEIKVKADNDNPEAYRILVCYKNCVLLKSEVDAVK